MWIKTKMKGVRSILLIALVLFAAPVSAENQCIRAGSREIILFDTTHEPCQMEFAPFDRQFHWKFASDNGRPSCWRDDGTIVYVATSSGVPNMYPRESIEDLLVCKTFTGRAVDEIWASEIEKCDDFDLPDRTAELSCYGALVLAERYFADSDPRLLLSIEHLSARTDDLAESEQLLKRSMNIRQKYFPSDYAGLVATLGGFGFLRKKQNNLDGAATAYLEAIRVGRLQLGEDHLEVIALTVLFGKMYLDAGMLPKAEEQLLLALANAEKRRPTFLSEAHSLAASSARLLAHLYEKQGKSTESDRYRELSRKHREAERSSGSREIGGQPSQTAPVLDRG